MTTVVLLGEAVRLLGNETDDIVDVEILEKYLPAIEQLKVSFILQDKTNHVSVRDGFSIRQESDKTISSFVQSVDCAIIF